MILIFKAFFKKLRIPLIIYKNHTIFIKLNQLLFFWENFLFYLDFLMNINLFISFSFFFFLFLSIWKCYISITFNFKSRVGSCNCEFGGEVLIVILFLIKRLLEKLLNSLSNFFSRINSKLLIFLLHKDLFLLLFLLFII